MKERAASQTRDTGTCETMPKHQWLHNVTVAAGVPAVVAEEHAAKLTLWFNSGEPVWLAADGLRLINKYSVIEERADKEANFLKREIARGNRSRQ